jgi:hypothetical protein
MTARVRIEELGTGDWGLGNSDWGLGNSDWGVGIWDLGLGNARKIPNPQSPVPKVLSPDVLSCHHPISWSSDMDTGLSRSETGGW